MKVLVTGGLGFIGSNFINYWLRQHPDDQVVNLDKMTYAANPNNIDQSLMSGNYTFVQGDICDRSLVSNMASSSDLIVNFAAESHVDNSIRDPARFVDSNYVGVLTLLEEVRRNDLRFHHISTDEVFGSLPLEGDEKFNLKTCYNPQNPYSATKAAADHLIRAYCNTYGIRATISNCSNNFGPNQHSEKLIPKTILNALEDRRIPVYGDGRNVRDWIYVIDHCSAIDAIVHEGESGTSYNVGAGNEASNLEVVKNLLFLMGKDESLIEYVKDRPGHDRRYAFDTKDVMMNLNWKPSMSFEEALKATVEHYTRNKQKYLP